MERTGEERARARGGDGEVDTGLLASVLMCRLHRQAVALVQLRGSKFYDEYLGKKV